MHAGPDKTLPGSAVVTMETNWVCSSSPSAFLGYAWYDMDDVESQEACRMLCISNRQYCQLFIYEPIYRICSLQSMVPGASRMVATTTLPPDSVVCANGAGEQCGGLYHTVVRQLSFHIFPISGCLEVKDGDVLRIDWQ